ncbi:MAG: leucyl aminopeptidase, partial [Candidatus Thiodiazotropha sp. (ex Rostrolucina anterorostrata)]|nr:leucyl aminopeptidase [Candidatus Thiodiazotropha sp. (ex Rostrolucina anterorostrata)]
ACRTLQRKNSLDLALVLPDTGLDAGDIGLAAAEGAYLGTYSYRKHLTKEADYGGLKTLAVASYNKFDKDAFEQGTKKGAIIACAIMLARDMANEPSNHMTPQAMADTAQKVAKDSGLKIEVLERRDMEKLGMGGILGVSRGSATTHPPKLIILRHNGRSGDGWDLALVGKGLTFDSGGISIKPSEKMEEMKFDMSGGAATIAAMSAIGQLKLELNVIAAIPATENMPDGGAFKPGDVLNMFTGKTVEVISTDAEGRLILADALGYIDREKPKAIVDIATLTGACVIALGDKASAAITNNQPLLDKVIKAGEAAGERIWQLPAWDEYREQYKSDYADIKNVGGRPAGTITAGLFLSEFISADTSWVHLDIAGTASGDKEKGHLTKGGSGVPVATLVNLAEMLVQE